MSSFFPPDPPPGTPGKPPPGGPFVPPPPQNPINPPPFGGQPFGGQAYGPPPVTGYGQPQYPQGPYPPGAAGPYAYTPLPQTSPLAIISLIAGMGSLVMSCCCGPFGLVTSVGAVLTGHLALISIHRSNGKVTGMAPAIIGLVTGYPSLLLAIGMTVLIFTHKPEDPGPPNSAANFLDRAENQILTDTHGVAHGNSPAAIALAEAYSKTLQKLRDENFTPAKGGVSLSGGQFIVYCELRPGQCAFLVHVPSYRKFDGDAKDSLADLAWLAAEQTTTDELKPGDELAVGLRGTLLYGAVMVGKVGDADGPDEQSEDKELLYPFFEPPDEPANGKP